ncbi:hypothetical protein [Promicromonospora kroppenstedtii]|uniref:hypothetical protein n=1 Tax=Promicromonospora kroppenstedtii TaxID=440482 RepID=UPI0004B5EC5C|nr:hypothetical protein [Promicromonospora kroppenstedtii]
MPDAPRIATDTATFTASDLGTPSIPYSLPILDGEVTQREGQTPLYQGRVVVPYDSTLWGVNPLYRGSGPFGPLCTVNLARDVAGNTAMNSTFYFAAREKTRSRSRTTMEFRLASKDSLALDGQVLHSGTTQTVLSQITSALRTVPFLEGVLVTADESLNAGAVNGLDVFDEGVSTWDTAQAAADLVGGIVHPQGSFFHIGTRIGSAVFSQFHNAFDPAGLNYFEPLEPIDYTYTRDSGYADGTFLRWSWTDANDVERTRTGLYLSGSPSLVQRVERRGAPPAGSTEAARNLAAQRMTERAIRRGSRIRLVLPFLPAIRVNHTISIPSDADESVSQTITVQEVVHSIGAATTTVIGA